MTVYKGTNKDMICTHGAGAFQYVLGQKMTAEKAKTAREGLHACEYVLDCVKWYSLKDGRFFRCTTKKPIDEEGEKEDREDGADTKISCEELTLERELSHLEIAYAAISYMYDHPSRSWERSAYMLQVKRDYAEATCAGAIAIARGKDPEVMAEEGAIVGLVKEDEGGEIKEMACLQASQRKLYNFRG